MVSLLVFSGVLLGVWYFIKKKYHEEDWVVNLSQTRTIFWGLMMWVVLGFLSRLDFTEGFGCVIFHEPVFDRENILYFAITSVLLLAGYFMSSRKLGSVFLIVELVFWLLKLFIMKGGYALYFGAVPSSSVLAYDLVALFLRLILIRQFLAFSFNPMFAMIPVVLILTAKILIFPVQRSIFSSSDAYEFKENATIVPELLIGEWISVVKPGLFDKSPLDLDSTLANIMNEHMQKPLNDTILLNFDSNFVRIKGIDEYDDKKFYAELTIFDDLMMIEILPDSIEGDSAMKADLGIDQNIGPESAFATLYFRFYDEDTMNVNLNNEYRFKATKFSNK